ncbi:MAG: cell division ATP-binding protein FtsE [Nitrospirae bacterium]|nr:cell division ATP-binding protein FtsE [Nitrospirota bacterium]
MIRFTKVSKYFGKEPVVTDIDLHIDKGELAYITGPSGAGKTTLLKLIYMAERPEKGEISVSKWDLRKIRQRRIPYLRRDIGIVFQDFKLLFNKTVFENIALAQKIRGVKPDSLRENVDRILTDVGLAHKSGSFPEHLSGGEQQKIAIARAMVSKPLILLADEPTGNLDHASAKTILSLFKEFNARGTTILIATHNSALFTDTGRKVIYLKDGKIEKETTG